MKVFVITLLLMCGAYSSQLNLNEKDKQLHLAGSALLTIAGNEIAKSYGYSDKKARLISSVSVLTIEAIKELRDGKLKNHTRDINDFRVDVLGVAIAQLLTFKIKF